MSSQVRPAILALVATGMLGLGACASTDQRQLTAYEQQQEDIKELRITQAQRWNLDQRLQQQNETVKVMDQTTAARREQAKAVPN